MSSSLNRVGSVPYSLALKGLQTAAKALPGRPEIWARNSYVLGTLVPLVSDLDITVWYDKEPEPSAVRALAALLATVKKAAPFLGEANLYVAGEAQQLGSLLNRFELLRDPELSRRFQGTPTSKLDTQAQAAAFMLRMLEADIHNVLNRPESRRRKWDSHVESVEKLTGKTLIPIWHNYPSRSLLRGLLDATIDLAAAGDVKVTEILEMYFECAGRDVPRHALKAVYGEKNWMWSAVPHRFCFDESVGERLHGAQAQLLEAQVSWELWGVASQYRLMPSKEARDSTAAHLRALSRLSRAALADGDNISKHIDTLLAGVLRAR